VFKEAWNFWGKLYHSPVKVITGTTATRERLISLKVYWSSIEHITLHTTRNNPTTTECFAVEPMSSTDIWIRKTQPSPPHYLLSV